MSDRILLEFFPELGFEIPESPGGSCCLKPVLTQSKMSKKLFLIAQHIRWMHKDKIDLTIPSKTDSRISLKKRYIQFKCDIRMKRLGIKHIPALALAGKLICQGTLPEDKSIEKIVKQILNNSES